MADQDKYSLTKLSKLCLNVITTNFDRFMGAYASADTVLAKNFEFLQRAYSNDLFKELADTLYFPKYMDFLLNKHLKELDVGLCHESCDNDLIVKQLKSVGKGVRILTLTGYVYTAEVLSELMCKLPKIKSLTLHLVYATDNVLRVIGEHCASLEVLILNNCYEVTDVGIMSLCPMEGGTVRKNSKLKHLDIKGTSVSDIGIAFVLRNFPKATMIQHNDVSTAIYNIHADDIRNNSVQLSEPYKLTELAINYDSEYMDSEFVKMCSLLCPYVTKLTIANVKSQSQVDVCVEFKQLKDVYFDLTFDTLSLSPFVEARGKSLEMLRVGGGSISVVPLLKLCSRLKCLTLESTKFEHFDKIPDPTLQNKFQHLKLISLDGMNFGLEVAAKSTNYILSSAPNLCTLNLVYAESFNLEFIDSIVEHECMKTIREMDISFSDIKLTAAKRLMLAIPGLRICLLQRCDLSIEDFSILQQLRPTLRLDWESSDVSEYSDYDNIYDDYEDDIFDNDYDYFDYDSENDYGDYPEFSDYDPDVYI